MPDSYSKSAALPSKASFSESSVQTDNAALLQSSDANQTIIVHTEQAVADLPKNCIPDHNDVLSKNHIQDHDDVSDAIRLDGVTIIGHGTEYEVEIVRETSTKNETMRGHKHFRLPRCMRAGASGPNTKVAKEPGPAIVDETNAFTTELSDHNQNNCTEMGSSSNQVINETPKSRIRGTCKDQTVVATVSCCHDELQITDSKSQGQVDISNDVLSGNYLRSGVFIIDTDHAYEVEIAQESPIQNEEEDMYGGLPRYFCSSARSNGKQTMGKKTGAFAGVERNGYAEDKSKIQGFNEVKSSSGQSITDNDTTLLLIIGSIDDESSSSGFCKDLELNIVDLLPPSNGEITDERTIKTDDNGHNPIISIDRLLSCGLCEMNGSFFIRRDKDTTTEQTVSGVANLIDAMSQEQDDDLSENRCLPLKTAVPNDSLSNIDDFPTEITPQLKEHDRTCQGEHPTSKGRIVGGERFFGFSPDSRGRSKGESSKTVTTVDSVAAPSFDF
jgi:hypothetical protein